MWKKIDVRIFLYVDPSLEDFDLEPIPIPKSRSAPTIEDCSFSSGAC